jgi:hypothetical protein
MASHERDARGCANTHADHRPVARMTQAPSNLLPLFMIAPSRFPLYNEMNRYDRFHQGTSL